MNSNLRDTLTAPAEKSAFGDFILANVRTIMADPFPYSVAYGQLGAYDGAVLCDSTDAIQILFFLPENKYAEEGSINLFFSDLNVSMYLRDSDKSHLSHTEIADCVKSLWDRFQVGETAHRRRQIARVHCEVLSLGPVDRNTAMEHARLLREIAGGLPHSSLRIDPLWDAVVAETLAREDTPFACGALRTEAEITLTSPVESDGVAQSVSRVLPSFPPGHIGKNVHLKIPADKQLAPYETVSAILTMRAY